jgi:hypothetical protein
MSNNQPVLSTFRSLGGPKMGYGPNNFSIKTEKRFDDTLERRASQVPGPGQYDPKIEVSANGQYVLNTYKNS